MSRRAVKVNVAEHLTSKSAEHLTPPHIIRAVLEVMGEIDLDPCAEHSPHNLVPGTYNVPAKVHYSINDKSIQQDWNGRVYMNPPYGATSDYRVLNWMEKMAGEIRAGHTTEAIVLWRASTDTDAWTIITGVCTKICMIKGRLSFGAATNYGPAPFPSVVFYYGRNEMAFEKVFGKLGQIWDRPTTMPARMRLDV